MPDPTLPIRLVPRKRSQIMPLSGFAFAFVVASVATLVMANERTRITFNGVEVTDPRVRVLFPILGLAAVLFCIGGVVAVAVKMLPRSPFFHINLSRDGLTMRRWFKQQTLSWRNAPLFETLQVETSSKNGTRINHYAVVMRPATPPPDASGDGTYLEEILRISADEYGATSEEEDAAALVEWFNALRKLAEERRLDSNSSIDVPEAFRSSVRPLAAAGGGDSARGQTVKRS